MKTRLFFIIIMIMLLISHLTYAQEKARSFIELSGGISSPMGNFASSDITSTASGYAQLGSHFAFNGAWYFSPYIGIGGSFSTSSYSVNVNQLANEVISAFDCDSATASARNYSTISFLIGPYFALPLGDLTIEARVLGGITNTTTPDFICQAINEPDATDPISISKYVQTSGTANAFGFDAGLGVKYAIGKHFGIVIRGDYFYSKPNISLDNAGHQDNAGREIFNYYQPISGINATFGVSYLF